MAHIQIRSNPEGGSSLVVNGMDLSMESFYGHTALVSVGEEPWAEVGLQVTLAVGRLDLDDDLDVVIADHLPEVAERVAAAVND